MIKINDDELINIKGGINITGTLLNATSTLIKNILDIGRAIGSSLRRLNENTVCKI